MHRGRLGPPTAGTSGPIIAACPIAGPAAADHMSGLVAGMNVARMAVATGFRLAVERELSYERHRRERSRGGQQLATGERLFSQR